MGVNVFAPVTRMPSSWISNVSPSLFESIELLGREKVLERLRSAVALARD